MAERAGQIVAGRLVVVLGGERRAKLVADQITANEEGVDAGERTADEAIALFAA